MGGSAGGDMLTTIITIALCGLALGGALEFILRAIEPEEFKSGKRNK